MTALLTQRFRQGTKGILRRGSGLAGFLQSSFGGSQKVPGAIVIAAKIKFSPSRHEFRTDSLLSHRALVFPLNAHFGGPKRKWRVKPPFCRFHGCEPKWLPLK
jgi:hypothetical protein